MDKTEKIVSAIPSAAELEQLAELHKAIPCTMLNCSDSYQKQPLKCSLNSSMIWKTVVSFIVKLYRKSHQKLCIPSLLLAGALSLFWTQCANGETVIWTGWMFRHHAVKIITLNNTKIG